MSSQAYQRLEYRRTHADAVEMRNQRISSKRKQTAIDVQARPMSRATHMMAFLGNEQLPILIVAIQPLQVKESKVTRARIVDTPSSWLQRSAISPIIASFRSRTCRW